MGSLLPIIFFFNLLYQLGSRGTHSSTSSAWMSFLHMNVIPVYVSSFKESYTYLFHDRVFKTLMQALLLHISWRGNSKISKDYKISFFEYSVPCDETTIIISITVNYFISKRHLHNTHFDFLPPCCHQVPLL